MDSTRLPSETSPAPTTPASAMAHSAGHRSIASQASWRQWKQHGTPRSKHAPVSLAPESSTAEQNPTFDTAVNALEDIDADYVLDAANDRLLEVSLLVSSHLWVSGASPFTIRSSFLWWLDRNRELAPEDVFLPISAWAEFLSSVATGRLQANERLKPMLRDDSALASVVEELAPETSNWTLTRNGLTVTFSPGTVAGNPAGMSRVFVSWEDLKPFLEPTLNPATLPTRLPRLEP